MSNQNGFLYFYKMKAVLISIILFYIIDCTFCQNSKAKERIPVHYDCVVINDSTQIKQTVVSVADYFSFLYDTFSRIDGDGEIPFDDTKYLGKHLITNQKELVDIFLRNWDEYTRKSKEKYIWYRTVVVPFTLILTKEENKKYKEFKKILDMPMVGLDYSIVNEYISWQWSCTEEFSDFFEAGYEPSVSLPTEQDYDKLINEYRKHLSTYELKGVKMAIGDSVNTKGCHLYNFKGSENCPAAKQRLEKYGTPTGVVGVYSYNPDLNGIYCLLGNVAEMTTTNGLAKGGHYKMYAKRILENDSYVYNVGDPLVGFRYVIRLKKINE